jgi:hypothetical protein
MSLNVKMLLILGSAVALFFLSSSLESLHHVNVDSAARFLEVHVHVAYLQDQLYSLRS